MVAGELPANPANPSGSGRVTIDSNIIEANLANDDGGGIRMLQAGNVRITITNNMIVDNVSTHEGGGIAFDDSIDVRIVNNTVMGNLTTATAATSRRQAAAGLSTTANSGPAGDAAPQRRQVQQPEDVQQHLLEQPRRQLDRPVHQRDRRAQTPRPENVTGTWARLTASAR